MTTALHFDRLTEEGLIATYAHCPVCLDSRREPSVRRPAFDRYMAALADELQLSVSELVALFCVYKCANCSTVYCDPWLSTDGMTRLYSNHHPQHLLGWQNFYQWVQREGISSHVAYQQRLWSLLTKVAGEVKTYAELSCPFMGLLFYFKDRDLKGQDKTDYVARGISRLQSTYLHPWNRRSASNRTVRSLFKLRKKVTRKRFVEDQIQYGNVNRTAIWRLKRHLSYPSYRDRGARAKPREALEAYPLPKRRYVVFQSSPCFWGTNCTSMNCSCRALSGSILDAPVIDFDDVRREGIKFDVFGIHNSLDHFMEPRTLVKRALEVSRLVFIDVHMSEEHSTFSRQHFYAFGRNFLDAIREEEWSYVDVTGMVQKPDQYCYLVSRELDLSGLHELGQISATV